MSFVDSLTPKDTEEIKPGLFVQNRKGNYRVVNPIAWKGQWRLDKQFGWKNLITIVIVIFVAYTYINETTFCRQLQANPCEMLPEIINYCSSENQLGVLEISEAVLPNCYNERGENLCALQGDP